MDGKDKDIQNALDNFYNKTGQNPATTPIPGAIPDARISATHPQPTKEAAYVDQMSRIDPDLTVGFEIVKLPSEGRFYSNGVSEVPVEYMTSKDEDIMSTPSLIENNTAIDILLKSKIKSKDLKVEDMLAGDKNAVAIFLRSTAYGLDYEVEVRDPRTGKHFNSKVDLGKLKYKKIIEYPDELLEFTVELPVKKRIVKFKLLPEREVDKVIKNARAMQEAYKLDYNPIGSLLLKAHITQIGHERSRDYINRFVDAMSPRDANAVKKKITEVTPNVDLRYTFTASDGYQFTIPIDIGIDFFFPAT